MSSENSNKKSLASAPRATQEINFENADYPNWLKRENEARCGTPVQDYLLN